MSTYMCECVLDRIHECVCMCICGVGMCTVYVCVRSWVGLHVAAVQTRLVRSGPIIRDLVSCSLWTDIMVIRRPMHEMIRRSVPVRAVKTRRWFDSETVSFHVSVRSYVSPYLPLSVCIYRLLLSFHVTFCYIYQFHYFYSFMRYVWLFTLITYLIWTRTSVILCVTSLSLLA